MLKINVRQHFELLYSRLGILSQVSRHRAEIFMAIVASELEKAREASDRNLEFEEILLDLDREHNWCERSIRRLQQRKG